jgi:hypothetical protein
MSLFSLFGGKGEETRTYIRLQFELVSIYTQQFDKTRS